MHILIQFSIVRAHGLEFFDFLRSHLMHIPIFICIDKNILISYHLLLLLSLLRLLYVFLPFSLFWLFALLLQTMQVLNHRVVFV